MGAKYTEAQNRATQKFIKDNYEPVTVRFPKGDREKYKAHAAITVVMFESKIEDNDFLVDSS